MAWPVETVALLELQDFQVSVSWLFTAVYKRCVELSSLMALFASQITLSHNRHAYL